jgi:aminoglycoside-2''-adenylyltransferase
MMDFELAKRILAAFEKEGVRYVLVGSMGMAVQGLVRATRDMDIFVSPDPENVHRLKAALRAVFNDPQIDEISAEDLGGNYPAIQYVPPTGDYSLDILARLGQAFSYDDLESEELSVDGIRVRVATPRMLYRMKKGTVRPRDRADAEEIKRHFKLEEEN